MPTAEIEGGNMVGVSAHGWTHNPALHDVISSAIASGALPLGRGGHHPVAAEGVGGRGLGPSREAGRQGRMRVAISAASGAYPLAQIARHHPPGGAGCGTPTTPHVGIGAAARAAALGEHVALVPGVYAPFALRWISGTRTQPLLIAPVGFNVGSEKAGPESSRDRCVVAPPVAVAGGSTLGTAPAVALTRCAHVRIAGLDLRRSRVGAAVTECTDVVLVHCDVACEAPAMSDGDPVLDASSCTTHSRASDCRLRILAGGLPAAVNVAGYASFLVLYALFGLLTLFVTAGLDDETANRWLISSAITTAVTAVVVQPVTAVAVAGFGFTNAVLMQALNRLTV
jgi:hypothetical protein